MSRRADRDAVWQSLNLAFYALTHLLEESGAIDQDRLADEISRFDPGKNDILRANLIGIVSTLRTRPFSNRPTSLNVIKGGKADPAE